MRPVDSKAESRVKTLIRAKLSWLIGYPVQLTDDGLTWYCLNPLTENENPIQINRNNIFH